MKRKVMDVYRLMDNLLTENKFGEIDNILRDCAVETSETIVLLAYARITFPARNQLREWQSYIVRIKEELTKRWPDRADHLLKGLNRDD